MGICIVWLTIRTYFKTGEKVFQIIFGLAVLAGLYVLIKAYINRSPGQKNAILGRLAIAAFCLILVGLVVTGRLHILVALAAALFPLVKQLPRLLPHLLDFLDRRKRGAESPEGTTSSRSPTGNLGVEEACQILGVSPQADRESVIEAHRRLIQKMHPDRGGSAYLAARINEARDVLLARKG